MVLNGKSSQEYPVMLEFLKAAPFLVVLHFFLIYINDHPGDVNCKIAVYADNTTLYSKCDQASDDLWQQPGIGF